MPSRLRAYASTAWLRSIMPAELKALLRAIRDLLRRAGQLPLQTPAARRAAVQEELQALSTRPTISIVLPTYRTELRYLREAVDSVRGQRYPEWELCIVDDGSGQPELQRALSAYAASDSRIKFRPLAQNGGISAASNVGLEMCEGEFVAFLDHDDTLTPDALLRVAQALAADPELDVVYSDSDKLTIRNLRGDPFLKPDWSPTYALGAMYVGHLLVVRRSVADAAGGFDSSFDTIQDFEFMLRVSERTDRIHHIPQILYHWRAIPGSIAAGTDQKGSVEELQPRAVSAHLARRGVAVRARAHPAIPHRAELAPPEAGAPTPPVSVIVGAGRAGDANRLLGSLLERTGYPDLEIIAIDGGGLEVEDPRLRRLDASGHPLGRGAANNRAAAEAGGRHLIFLGPETEIADGDWIERLLLHAALPGVVAVGPMLVRPGGTVAQAGVAIGLR
ncbi:MAG: glycosyltransferase family 2 protein, partial [Syntrophothermus sp.]